MRREEEHWLDGLELHVKNISSKTIVHFSVHLMFHDMKPVIGYVEYFRLEYEADPQVKQAPPGQTPLAPGHVVTFEISGSQYERVKKFVGRRLPVVNLTTVEFNTGTVVFDNDTAWDSGSFMHRDPSGPGRWRDND